MLFAAEASASGHENGLQALQKGDAETALQELKPAAEAGNDQAQFFLGLMFYDGIGVQQDYQAAARLMLLSAEQGFANAQHVLGLLYRDGNGVQEDERKAATWQRRAAE